MQYSVIFESSYFVKAYSDFKNVNNNVLASLSHAIFCVACDSKYIDTSSSCRLESGIRQTFSADPNYLSKMNSHSLRFSAFSVFICL
ncbi:MAG: hypothetical protein AB7D35_07920 [Bacteroidales bacterium]|nr:hypothetical protein [Bacteroidales bacterium]